jgi:hypothetical protein
VASLHPILTLRIDSWSVCGLTGSKLRSAAGTSWHETAQLLKGYANHLARCNSVLWNDLLSRVVVLRVRGQVYLAKRERSGKENCWNSSRSEPTGMTMLCHQGLMQALQTYDNFEGCCTNGGQAHSPHWAVDSKRCSVNGQSRWMVQRYLWKLLLIHIY